MRKHVVLILLLTSACTPKGDVPAPSPAGVANSALSFADLFGLDLPRAKAELPAKLFNCLAEAHEDFNLALAGKTPSYAKEEGAMSDGGTSNWKGSCYSLTILRQLTTMCFEGRGVSGVIVGPMLRIDRANTNTEVAPISRTRFVAGETGAIPGAEYVGCAAP